METIPKLFELAAMLAQKLDARNVAAYKDLAVKLMYKEETWRLMRALTDMRDPIAAILKEEGMITEEEAKRAQDGGLGLIALLIKVGMKKDSEV